MPVPLLDLKAQYATLRTEMQAAINRVLEGQRFILGPEVEALEAAIAPYVGCDYAVGVSSGTDALLAALMVLDLQPGDEVITTAYSFFATAGCIARLGGIPVFVDIDPHTYNLDANALEDQITSRTRAIIPVHLFGQMADMSPIMALAQQYNLVVIEDAAQAIGAEYQGRRAGSFGHMACFSFFPSKNLGAYGDGGMVTTNDPDLADRLRLVRNHGYRPKYYNRVVGGNFRLDALQAAVLRVKFPYLEQWHQARQRNAARYVSLFQSAGLAGNTDGKARIILPDTAPGNRHIYNQFVIRHTRRDALQAALKAHGIGCEVYYPLPLHLQECFVHLGYEPGDIPHSEAAARESLALPIYPELTEDQQHAVVAAIQEFVLD
ncbi:MAG: DegT/DnrJ/EryC1/StrS family aminotransferase [Chloroflexi bacterium]|nr:DegT/DnrJ/EryC1/StrS family aminotransferase [Chloroflexota bacterium]